MIHFEGWCHEYMVVSGLQMLVLNDCCVRHDSAPHASSGEDSNQRNLRILTAQWAQEPNARTAFYLASTHKDAGRWPQAIEWFQRRLGFDIGFRDEYLFTLLYLARVLRRNSDVDGARQVLAYALALEPTWMEFRMELASIAHDERDYAAAIDEASKALKQPIPQTPLWRERAAYTDQPARLISWCHEHLRNLDQAIVWGELAKGLIGQPDAAWDARLTRLREEIGRIGVRPARQCIALHRPGAIGDILMTLNLVPTLREAHPDAEITYFCAGPYAVPDALGWLMAQAGVDLVLDCAALPAWRKRYDRVIDLIGYPLAEGYPERPMQKHLLEYFAAELGLEAKLPALEARKPKRPIDLPPAYASLQVHAGWSRYKEWPLARWNELLARADLPPFVQIGAADCELVRGAIDARGLNLRQSIAIVANATLHVGIDSFGNHLTNYFWREGNHIRRVPGVILWGSTQWEAAGYPQNVNISYRPSCGPCFREDPKISRMPRGPCINLSHDGTHRCMERIEVAEVAEAVRALGQRETKQLVAA